MVPEFYKAMDGVYPTKYTLYEDGGWVTVDGAVTEEILLCIHVNGVELASFMCTPHDPDELALGYLRSEGIIHGPEEVRLMSVSASGACVDVWLDRSDVELPKLRVLTSGCGGGVTHVDSQSQVEPLRHPTAITPDQIFARIQELNQAASLYHAAQGIHASALSDGERLLLVAEDIGRHNTIDRLWGKAMKQGLSTEGLTLLSTGRISSEMLFKAAKMGTPVVASRTSATSLSVSMGEAWNITLIGYVRGRRMRVYTAPERIVEAAVAIEAAA
jgi:FdhD protein